MLRRFQQRQLRAVASSSMVNMSRWTQQCRTYISVKAPSQTSEHTDPYAAAATTNQTPPVHVQDVHSESSKEALDQASLSYVPTNSPIAYHNRLERGLFRSPLELTRAAYAPSRFAILLDLLEKGYVNDANDRTSEELRVKQEQYQLTPEQLTIFLEDASAEVDRAVEADQLLGNTQTFSVLKKQFELFRRLDTLLFGDAETKRQLAAKKEASRSRSGRLRRKNLSADPTPSTSSTTSEATVEEEEGHDIGGAVMETLFSMAAADNASAKCQWSLLVDRHLYIASKLGLWQESLTGLWALRNLEQQTGKSSAKEEDGKEEGTTTTSFTPLKLSPRHFERAMMACGNEKRFDEAMVIFNFARSFDKERKKELALARQAYHYSEEAFENPLPRGEKQQQLAGVDDSGLATDWSSSFESATSSVVAGLASCIGTKQHLEAYRSLFVSELSEDVPITGPLYAAIIQAAGRVATLEPDYAEKAHEFSLSLYRSLRDNEVTPPPEAYSGLMAVTAAMGEPTKAFAFYHEAKLLHTPQNLPPELYTNLLRSYITGGFAKDALDTFEVLLEAQAPLNRQAFHLILQCPDISLRDTYDVLELMVKKHNIPPTPETYKYVVNCLGVKPEGVNTLLAVYDVHQSVKKIVVDMHSAEAAELMGKTRSKKEQLDGGDLASALLSDGSGKHAATGDATTVQTSKMEEDTAVMELLSRHHAGYVVAVESCLLRTKLPLSDLRKRKDVMPYAVPLVQSAQRRMNAVATVEPQTPTRLPQGGLVGIVGYDVLLHGEEALAAIADQFSSLVISYSTLALAFQEVAQHCDAESGKSAALMGDAGFNLLNDDSRGAAQMQGGAADEGGRKRSKFVNHALEELKLGWGTHEEEMETIQRFLRKYYPTIHLMSLADEVNMSLDVDRYGFNVKDMRRRCVAVAMNLSRGIGVSDAGDDAVSEQQRLLYRASRSRIVILSSDPLVHNLVKSNALVRKQKLWAFDPMKDSASMQFGQGEADDEQLMMSMMNGEGPSSEKKSGETMFAGDASMPMDEAAPQKISIRQHLRELNKEPQQQAVEEVPATQELEARKKETVEVSVDDMFF